MEKINPRKDSDSDDDHNKDIERRQRADLAAQAAIRRLSNENINKPGITLPHDDTLITPREESDLTRLRERLQE